MYFYRLSKNVGLKDEEKVSLERPARWEVCRAQAQGKQAAAGSVVYLQGQWDVLRLFKENNKGRQADQSLDSSLGRKCGKGENKKPCGYF